MDGAVGRGSQSAALTADFVSSENWLVPADYIAIARHEAGVCEAARVWKYATPGTSLYDVFKPTSTYQRATLTSGGVRDEVVRAGQASTTDPVMGCAGDLVVNWWHANNGARIALDCGHLSIETANDDDTHGPGPHTVHSHTVCTFPRCTADATHRVCGTGTGWATSSALRRTRAAWR